MTEELERKLRIRRDLWGVVQRPTAEDKIKHGYS